MADVQTAGYQPRSVWERHFQTFVGIAMMALGIWLFDTVSNQTVHIAVQTEKIITLTNRFDIMQRLLSDRYTASDAAKDFALRDAMINRLKRDVSELREDDYPNGDRPK